MADSRTQNPFRLRFLVAVADSRTQKPSLRFRLRFLVAVAGFCTQKADG